MAIEIVDLPIKIVMFHSFLYVYQRGVHLGLYIRLTDDIPMLSSIEFDDLPSERKRHIFFRVSSQPRLITR